MLAKTLSSYIAERRNLEKVNAPEINRHIVAAQAMAEERAQQH